MSPTFKMVTARGAQVAGLDVGWGQRLDMALDAAGTSFILTRELPTGKFNYKFLFDGHWSYSANHPMRQACLHIRISGTLT